MQPVLVFSRGISIAVIFDHPTEAVPVELVFHDGFDRRDRPCGMLLHGVEANSVGALAARNKAHRWRLEQRPDQFLAARIEESKVSLAFMDFDGAVKAILVQYKSIRAGAKLIDLDAHHCIPRECLMGPI